MPSSESRVADTLAQAAQNIASAEGLLHQASRVLAQSRHCVEAIEVLGAALSDEVAPDLDAVRQALEGLAFEPPLPAAGIPAAALRIGAIPSSRFPRRVPAALV